MSLQDSRRAAGQAGGRALPLGSHSVSIALPQRPGSKHVEDLKALCSTLYSSSNHCHTGNLAPSLRTEAPTASMAQG